MSTINGGNGPDHISAPSSDDSIYGNGGNDTLNGGGGNDYVDGGTGNDIVAGGVDWDTLLGGPGDDTMDGGADYDLVSYSSSPVAVEVDLVAGTASDGFGGTDTLLNIENIQGSAFDDTLQGDSGPNWFYPAGGDDTVHAGDGLDTVAFVGFFSQYSVITGGTANELIVSGPDGVDDLFDVEFLQFNDVIVGLTFGTQASEVLGGDDGSDVMFGGGGNDTVTGAGGDDRLYGGTGVDSLSGGTGNDILDGGTGRDTMEGGTGNDTYYVDDVHDVVVEPDSNASVPQGAAGQVSIGDSADTVLTSIDYTLGNALENMQQIGSLGLSGSGNALANGLTGNDAGDTLLGLAGDDTISGAGGNDSMDGGVGNDSMDGGSGDDTLAGGNGDDSMQGGAGNDTLDGGDGSDTVTYGGLRLNYTVSAALSHWTVSGEGTDSLSNVERIAFADSHVALDLDDAAGDVAKVLGAVFGASLVDDTRIVGIGLSYADAGMTYEELMNVALQTALGTGIASSKAVVDLLWANVVGGAPDPATEQSFMDLIDHGGYTPATLGVLAANSSFNLANIGWDALAVQGLPYT